MKSSLVVKVTVGADEPERCSMAVTVAASAAAAGIDVALWLAGEAAWLAVPGRAEAVSLPHATPLPDLLRTVADSGDVVVCAPCAKRRDLGPSDLLPGTRIAGAAQLVEAVMADGARSLVY